jgi:hypothetical protein
LPKIRLLGIIFPVENVRKRQQTDYDAIALQAELLGISQRLEEIDSTIAKIATLPDLTAKRDTLLKSLDQKRLYVLKVEEATLLKKKREVAPHCHLSQGPEQWMEGTRSVGKRGRPSKRPIRPGAGGD